MVIPVYRKGVRVYHDTLWQQSIPYIYVDGEWIKCNSMIYDNYTWIGGNTKVELEDRYLLTSERYNLVTSDMLYLKGRKG